MARSPLLRSCALAPPLRRRLTAANRHQPRRLAHNCPARPPVRSPSALAARPRLGLAVRPAPLLLLGPPVRHGHAPVAATTPFALAAHAAIPITEVMSHAIRPAG